MRSDKRITDAICLAVRRADRRRAPSPPPLPPSPPPLPCPRRRDLSAAVMCSARGLSDLI